MLEFFFRKSGLPSDLDEMNVKQNDEMGSFSSNGVGRHGNNNSNNNNSDINNAIETPRNKKEMRSKTLGNFLRSSAFKLYIGHFLSSWGDRMWSFAVAVFLIGLDSNSLRLPAIYGLSIGASGLLFKTLVGDWVDRTPRMKTVVVALAIQNLSVTACAGVVILLLLLGPAAAVVEEEGAERASNSEVAGWWWTLLCEAVIIIIACVANLASSAMKISIQKDWIVVVSGDADDLARMNSVIRSIDLLAKILAPIATGLIMAEAGHVIGAAFIAGWNLISLFAEYVILRKVYRDNPALKMKAGDNSSKKRPDDDDHNDEEFQTKKGTGNEDEDEIRDTRDEESEQELGVKQRRESGIDEETGEGFLDNKRASSSSDVEEAMEKDANTLGYSDNMTDAGKDESAVHGSANDGSLRPGEEEMEDRDVTTVVYEPTPAPNVENDDAVTIKTSPEATSKTKSPTSPLSAFKTLAGGWSTYMRHRVRDAGLGLAFLYMTVLGFDSITIGYAYSQGLCASWLGGLQAAGAVMGMLGTISYPTLRRRVGLERTGLFASGLQISCLCLCLVAIFLPGTPFVLLHPELPQMDEVTTIAPLLHDNGTTHHPGNQSDLPPAFGAVTESVDVLIDVTRNRCKKNPYDSYVSIGVMMAGIILARFGLWNLDLTITQILQEQVGESERGIVNGVQHSLQDLLDMIKFVLVIFIPHPKHFAYLVILSFIFVTAGGGFYASYTTRVRGHFFHFEMLRARSKRGRKDQAHNSDHGSGKISPSLEVDKANGAVVPNGVAMSEPVPDFKTQSIA